jgi:hypothetical protein
MIRGFDGIAKRRKRVKFGLKFHRQNCFKNGFKSRNFRLALDCRAALRTLVA